MAVTINDLLGNNYNIADNKISAFPSFEEYKNRDRKSNVSLMDEAKPKYDFETHTPQSVTEEELKSFEASTPFQPPKANEFVDQEYDFLETLNRPKFEAHQTPSMSRPQDVIKHHDFDFNKIVGDYDTKNGVQQETSNGLYEFTKNDNDRLSEEELMGKLEQTSSSSKHRTIVTRKTNVETERKARLNTKGKVILSVYVVLMLVVAILIGVHAGEINSGMAVAPTSNSAENFMVQTIDTVEMSNYASAMVDTVISAANLN